MSMKLASLSLLASVLFLAASGEALAAEDLKVGFCVGGRHAPTSTDRIRYGLPATAKIAARQGCTIRSSPGARGL